MLLKGKRLHIRDANEMVFIKLTVSNVRVYNDSRASLSGHSFDITLPRNERGVHLHLEDFYKALGFTLYFPFGLYESYESKESLYMSMYHNRLKHVEVYVETKAAKWRYIKWVSAEEATALAYFIPWFYMLSCKDQIAYGLKINMQELGVDHFVRIMRMFEMSGFSKMPIDLLLYPYLITAEIPINPTLVAEMVNEITLSDVEFMQIVEDFYGS